MRPIGAPKGALSSHFHELTAERHNIVPGRIMVRAPIAVGQQNPPVVAAEQLADQLEHGLLDAVVGMHVAHVIDDQRDGDLFQQVLDVEPFRPDRMDLHVPAEPFDAVDRASEAFRCRRQIERFPEIEPGGTAARVVEALQFLVADAVVNDRDAAIVGMGGQGVDNDVVVHAVRGSLHDHAAIEPEFSMHPRRRLDGRIGGGTVGAAGPDRITLRIAEDMDLTVATAGWWSLVWSLGVLTEPGKRHLRVLLLEAVRERCPAARAEMAGRCRWERRTTPHGTARARQAV